jgi:hypothetical protein
MSAFDFEQTLRDRMKAHAAELDCAVGSAPPLGMLLADQRRFARPKTSTGLRLALAVAAVAAATVAVVALALVAGSPLAQRLPDGSHLSSVTPSPLPAITLTPSPSLSPSPSPAEPTKSAPPTVSTGVLTVLVAPEQGDGLRWASGGGRTVSLWQ